MSQEKLQKWKKSTYILEYQKDILALVYVGTPLFTSSFLSPQAWAEGYYWTLCGYTELKFKKYLKIKISNWYSVTCICKYWPIPMPIFESPRQSRGLILCFCWKLYKIQKVPTSWNIKFIFSYMYMLVLTYPHANFWVP